MPTIWAGVMLIARCYEERFLWVGAEEFRRVFFAAMMLPPTLGTVSWAFQLDVARGFVVFAVPLATFLTLVQRYAQRQLLHRARRRGRHLQTTLLVGYRESVAALHEQLGREAFNGLPALGDLGEVAEVVARDEVDTWQFAVPGARRAYPSPPRAGS